MKVILNEAVNSVSSRNKNTTKEESTLQYQVWDFFSCHLFNTSNQVAKQLGPTKSK